MRAFMAGRIFADAGQLTRAEPYLEQAATLEPGSAEIQLALAKLKTRQAKYDQAKAHLARAEALSPELPALFAQRGATCAASREPDCARAALDEWTRVAPQDPQAWLARGELALAEEDGELAVLCLRRARALGLASAPLLRALTKALEAVGHHAAAAEVLEALGDLEPPRQDERVLALALAGGDLYRARAAALRLTPKEAPREAPYVLLSGLLARQGDLLSAVRILEMAKEDLPQSLALTLLHAELLLQVGREEQALALLEAPITGDDAMEKERRQLKARALLAKQAYPEAVALLREQQRDDEQPWSTLLLSVALASSGQPKEAKALLLALESKTKTLELKIAVAQTWAQVGDQARALTLTLALLREAPNHPILLNFVGYSWIEEGGPKLAEAEAMLERALMQTPESAAVLDSLGWARFWRGKDEAAVALLRESARRSPDEPEILAHLGCALRAVGQTDEASRRLDRAERLAPQQMATFDAACTRALSYRARRNPALEAPALDARVLTPPTIATLH